jgi:hypothetical protein
MPGQYRQVGGRAGGGGMGGGGMGADIISGSYGGPGSSSLNQGWGAAGGPGSNFGAGDRPPDYTEAMARYQQQCMAGDGNACNQLQMLQSMQQQQQQDWQSQAQQGQNYYQNQPGQSMGARSSGPVRY